MRAVHFWPSIQLRKEKAHILPECLGKSWKMQKIKANCATLYPIQPPPSDSKNWDATLRGSNSGIILQHHTADSNMNAAKDGV
jgi:hypothetical protein